MLHRPIETALFLRRCRNYKTTAIRECFLKGMVELMESCTQEALCASFKGRAKPS